MNLAPTTAFWFARHEFALGWRDFVAMATGGKRVRGVILVAVLTAFAAGLHALAGSLLRPWVESGIVPDKATLVLITGAGLLFWTVMLSQALESVTRAYYARSDLDLILSSPAPSRTIFAVRTGMTALTTMLLACLLASPIIDMLAILDGPHWLAAYGVLAALGALSTAIAVLVTIGLFALVGPKRTRIIAQIIAAVVGAGFVIGIQAAAIVAYGDYSRFAILQSDDLVAAAPPADSLLWLPAHAAMGSQNAFIIVTLIGLGALVAVTIFTAGSFGRHALAAAGLSRSRGATERRAVFRPASQKAALRRKEWLLLARDPWLLSQTLMQILYLVPPALLLWINFGADAGVFIVIVPVLVMASGQLAGGLAWLAVSGEDAHDLVVTAPLSSRTILVAKIEAVLAVIAAVLVPLLALMAISSPAMALVTGLGAGLSAGSATAIQLWFRTPMRRAMFRRRQVASRLATLSEAFASIIWAGAAALVAAGGLFAWTALVPAILALLILLAAWLLSPKGRP